MYNLYKKCKVYKYIYIYICIYKTYKTYFLGNVIGDLRILGTVRSSKKCSCFVLIGRHG